MARPAPPKSGSDHPRAAPRRPRRAALGRRYDRRRDELVEHAAAVFAREGYERTSMQALAEHLGLATGAIYHYFPGKESLLVAICDQLMDPLLARTVQLGERDGSPEERLAELMRVWVAHVVEHRDHLLVFTQVRHMIDHGDAWRGVRRSRKAFEEILARVLREASPPGDERLVLSALLGMVNHVVQWYRPRGRLRPEEIADGYTELVLGPPAGGR